MVTKGLSQLQRLPGFWALLWPWYKVLHLWPWAQCYVGAWMGEGSGGEWILVRVWLSPFTAHLKLSQHCYGESKTIK